MFKFNVKKPIAFLCAFVSLTGFFAPLSAFAEEPNATEYIFYPDPPNRPRLQFLKSYGSALDVKAEKSGFRDFVFGGEENEGQLVEKPYGVAVHEGAIYVVDIRGNGYGVYDVAGGQARFVRPGGRGALSKPINIAVDLDGTRYITDAAREQVVVFDANDNYRAAFDGPGDEYSPSDVAISGDRIYVSDTEGHRVLVLDKRTGEILSTIGGHGEEPGQFTHPANMVVAPDGSLYVTDTSNFRIQHFDNEGSLIRVIGAQGAQLGGFVRPKGVAVDRENRIWVADAAFENIQIFDPEGLALMGFGSAGGAPQNINMPAALVIDYDSVEYFKQYAAPGFELEFLVVIASQFGTSNVTIFGFGSMPE